MFSLKTGAPDFEAGACSEDGDCGAELGVCAEFGACGEEFGEGIEESAGPGVGARIKGSDFAGGEVSN